MKGPEAEELPLGYEQPDAFDRLLALFCGIGAAALSYFLSNGILHPAAWTETAVAAGLMPPEKICPGLGRMLTAGVFRLADLADGIRIVVAMGSAACGIAAALFYLMLRELLPAVLSLRSQSRLWTFHIERLVALAGVFAFVCAEPVYRLFLSFSGETFLVLLSVWFLRMFLRLLHYGRFSTAYTCLFVLGVLSAETPFGLAVSFCAAIGVIVARRLSWRPDLRYFNPMLMELSKWRLSASFAVGFLVAYSADLAYFAYAGGMEAIGAGWTRLPVEWVLEYGRTAYDAATVLGWFLLILFAAVPFSVAIFTARRATDDDSFLPFKTGLLFIALFWVTLAPLSTLPYLRFWAWTRNASVQSGYLLACAGAALSIAFALSLAVWLFDIWCRDHRRIALQRFPDLIEDGALARRIFRWTWRRTVTVFIFAGIALAIAPGRRDRASRHLAEIVRDTVRETVKECGDAANVVTDGSLDAALRLESALRGGALVPVSVMAGHGDYDRYLRVAVAENDEERETLTLGAADALRTWVSTGSPRLDRLAVQIGFEMWRHGGVPRPPASGLVLRKGMAPETVAAGIAAARALAERVISSYGRDDYGRSEDRTLKEKFLFCQWRLARMASIRAEDFDRAGDIDRSREEAGRAAKLDELNGELQRIRNAISWIRNREGDSLTPREGLRIALERADFALARRYATPILASDKSNPDANFGMGMSYFIEEKYAQAAIYLEAALKSRPGEPAILNNLAICLYKTGKAQDALPYARKAVVLLPKAPAVRNTYEEIRKAAERIPAQ